jgi:hypothetical protein
MKAAKQKKQCENKRKIKFYSGIKGKHPLFNFALKRNEAKNTEAKQRQQKNTEAKQSEQKNTEAKQSEQKNTEAKQSKKKITEEKQSEKKSTEAKRSEKKTFRKRKNVCEISCSEAKPAHLNMCTNTCTPPAHHNSSRL